MALIHRPEMITFTGADDDTDIQAMVDLALDYPVEFGILFSPKRQGKPRYPSPAFVSEVIASGIPVAAHICGGYSREIIERGETSISKTISGFMRAQVNTSDPVKPAMVSLWAMTIGVVPILQCRDEFPKNEEVRWLFDRSGGTGELSAFWPKHPGYMVGYAGGINPDNVLDVVSKLPIDDPARQFYWIDMETGVRDADDKFSIDRCRKVCQAVYG